MMNFRKLLVLTGVATLCISCGKTEENETPQPAWFHGPEQGLGSWRAKDERARQELIAQHYALNPNESRSVVGASERPGKSLPPADQTSDEQSRISQIGKLRMEGVRLRQQNEAMSRAGITDARAFAANDRRVMQIVTQINDLEGK